MNRDRAHIRDLSLFSASDISDFMSKSSSPAMSSSLASFSLKYSLTSQYVFIYRYTPTLVFCFSAAPSKNCSI